MKKNLFITLSLLFSGAMVAQQPSLPDGPGSVVADLTLEESPVVGATLIGAGTYNNGEIVSFSATAPAGYHFVKWNDDNTNASRNVTLTEHTTFVANFATNQYTLGVAAQDCSDTLYYTYDYGTEVEIEAVANADNHFVAWNDGNTDNPRTITIVSDMILVAEFHGNYIEIPVEANTWRAIALPVAAATTDATWKGNGTWAKYNSADRANYGRVGWEYFAEGETALAANQGYIFQSDIADTVRFDILPESLPAGDITIALTTYAANHDENANWNLIGNPYYAHYDIGGIAAKSYTSPLVVWNGIGYDVYEPGHDEMDLLPLEGFFVQKPVGKSQIEFDATYTESTVEAIGKRVPKCVASHENRKYVDLVATVANYSDRARLVLDDAASIEYEIGRDVVKFHSVSAPVQLYMVDVQNVECAVYERPNDDDMIALGYTLAADADITITAMAMDETYFLYDSQTRISVDLNKTDYTFRATAGTSNGRLLLCKENQMPYAVEILTKTSVVKMIENNQVVIYRDGKKYSTLGVMFE